MSKVPKNYKSWLEREIEKADKAEATADQNYQMLGMQRYANARENAEYLGRALRVALATEEGVDERRNQARRAFGGLRDGARKYAACMKPDEALDRIIDDLTKSALFGG